MEDASPSVTLEPRRVSNFLVQWSVNTRRPSGEHAQGNDQKQAVVSKVSARTARLPTFCAGRGHRTSARHFDSFAYTTVTSGHASAQAHSACAHESWQEYAPKHCD